ncbi:hypothetical protein CDAR_469551 [Caerostris darwini]|uniref:Ribosomal protein S10 n=1 Tax=Caerostris darwini TaxID=1538125 RepID=A0AAV4R0D2_9ARAC|nr:hypothetical protein CDAR_469551 [Caerostris darwini]
MQQQGIHFRFILHFPRHSEIQRGFVESPSGAKPSVQICFRNHTISNPIKLKEKYPLLIFIAAREARSSESFRQKLKKLDFLFLQAIIELNRAVSLILSCL